MVRFIILGIILIGMFVLLYKLLSDNKEKSEKKVRLKWLDHFNKPIFKIPIGASIILITLVSTLRLVKVLPIVAKLGLIAIDFVIIYAVIIYLFNNKQKSN